MQNNRMIYLGSFFYSSLATWLFITFFYREDMSALSSLTIPVILLAPIVFWARKDVSLFFISSIVLLGLELGIFIDFQIKNIATWKIAMFAWFFLSLPAIGLLNIFSILIRKYQINDMTSVAVTDEKEKVIQNAKGSLVKKVFVSVFLIGCCFLGLFLYSWAQKNNSEFGRFAKKDEIVGCWKLVPIPPEVAQKINKVNPWPLPYQWFAIYNDGRIFSYMSSNDQNLKASELEETFKVIPANMTYEFNSGFMTISYSDLKNIKELWGVNLIKKEVKIKGVAPTLPGDIVMSLQGSQKDGVIYYRHLRKIY